MANCRAYSFLLVIPTIWKVEKLGVEESIINQINNLIERSINLKVGDSYKQVRNENQLQECSGWIASPLNVVQLVYPNPEHAYRKRAEKIEDRKSGWVIHRDVGEFASLLTELNRDIKNGLLASIADRTRAETFDNFLDQFSFLLMNVGLSNSSSSIPIPLSETSNRIFAC